MPSEALSTTGDVEFFIPPQEDLGGTDESNELLHAKNLYGGAVRSQCGEIMSNVN